MGSIVTAAEQLAQRLVAAGIPATHDPARAATNRPCVLVPPPSIDYTAKANTWRLAALASHPGGTLDALRQLDELVVAVTELLDVETAEPGSYVLHGGAEPVPAYVLRLTT